MKKGLPKGKTKTKAKAPKNKAQAGLFLKKPKAISKKPAWFEEFYKKGSDAQNDRILFSS